MFVLLLVVFALLPLQGNAQAVSTQEGAPLSDTQPSLPGIVASPLPSAVSVEPSNPSPLSVAPTPLPVYPPEIIAEAGMLPTNVLAVFDRLSEFFERNVFSFGIPTLRARIALTQAAERIAELQGLERNGRLTPASARGLLEAQERLLTIADQVLARQFRQGTISLDLLLLLTRTRLAAAETLEELREERDVLLQLDEEPLPSPASLNALPEDVLVTPADEEHITLTALLDANIEHLVDFEGKVIPQGEANVPKPVLRLLAEQKIAKAERDIVRAVRKTEERAAQGKILVADVELRSAADAVLLTARQLFTEGNASEALSLAQDARRIAGELKSGQIALEPDRLRSEGAERHIERIIQQLVEQGTLNADAQQAALLRARQALEQVRETAPVSPLPLPVSNEGSGQLEHGGIQSLPSGGSSGSGSSSP